MKKASRILILVLVFALAVSPIAHANMAAPARADVGSSITFEKNDAIAVRSEVLDITVHGSQADISAVYTMKNTTAEKISTPAMFLSPNIESGGTRVLVNGRETDFTTERYEIASWSDSEIIAARDWRYVVLTNESSDGKTVNSIDFEMSFEPQEEYEVAVFYAYRLGGYPDYDFNAKDGEIEYYLAPAALWKDFENLTINLYLDEDMPVIKSSNLDFKKTGARTYQYVSDTLPEENLRVVIDENWFQNIFSTLRSPYFTMNLLMFSPFILLILAVVAIVCVILWQRHKKKKRAG